MADLRIVDAPEIPINNITGQEKIPTGGSGNYSISLDSVADYTKTKKDLADNNSVDGKVNSVRQELESHIEDVLNPHQVTKEQVGLGNVDNTADLDKPVSNSAQAAIISAVAPKADKTYVDNQLTLKANKADVYTKQESSDLVNNSISTALAPVNTSLDLAKRGIANRYDPLFTYNSGERVVLTTGDIVKSTISNNTNDPNVDMIGWVKDNSASQIFDESGKTQQEINNEQSYRSSQKTYLADYLRKMNTSPTDDISVVLNQIKSDGVKKLYVNSGTYNIDSVINFTSDFEFENESGVVFDFGDTGAFYASGSHTEIGTLTSNLVKNVSSSFTASSVEGISVGDWICLYCTTDYSFSPYRDYYRKGEFLEVAGVTGNTITFYGRAFDNYLSSEPVKLLKINPINFNWNQISVKSSETNPNVPIVIDYARNFNIENFKTVGGLYTGIRLRRCLNFTIGVNSASNTSALNTLNYAVQVSNSQNFRYFGGQNNSMRHAFALGGDGTDLGCVPCRKGKVYGASLYSGFDNTSGADMHGNVELVTYDHCTTNYATMSGADNTYMNCDIYERPNQGCVILAEPLGGTLSLINNTYYTSSGLNTWAVIHTIIKQQLKNDLTIKLVGGRIVGTGGTNAQIVSIRQDASLDQDLVKKVNVHVTGGVTCDFDALALWVRIEHAVSGSRLMPIGYIIIDDVVNTKSGVQPYLIYPSPSTSVAPTRQMRQAGTTQISSVLGATITRSLPIDLKYKYHKQPSVLVTVGNILGTAAWDYLAFDDGTSSPQRTPVATNCFVSVSQVRPMVFWNKSVATEKTFNLNWSCEVNEI